METRFIIAGSGGQGVLFLGKALAMAAMSEGKHVTWFPSYGAEMRGGTANCTVIISEEMIGSPVVETPDVLVAMNRASFDKFQKRLRPGGVLFYDSSLMGDLPCRPDILAIAVPATSCAARLGSTKAANVVMLGAIIAQTEVLEEGSVSKLFNGNGARAKEAAVLNTNSLLEGIRHIEDKKSNHRRRQGHTQAH